MFGGAQEGMNKTEGPGYFSTVLMGLFVCVMTRMCNTCLERQINAAKETGNADEISWGLLILTLGVIVANVYVLINLFEVTMRMMKRLRDMN